MPTADELLCAPLLKLERARDHIKDLNARVNQFLAKHPFVLMERHQRKAGRTTYSVMAKESIPPELSLIIGDAVHNMRAALDMALFGMVGDREPKIHFPFPKEPTPEALKRAIKEGHVKVAGKKVVEAISSLEPHINGKGIALYCIHALDIQDKHHLLILAAQRAAVVTGSPSGRILREVLRPNTPDGILIVFDAPENANALTINRPYVTHGLPDSENEAKEQPAFAITFGEGEMLAGTPVVETLVDFAKEADRAVRELVTAFLDPNNAPHS